MDKPFKPLLAATLAPSEDALRTLPYPVLWSPKLDGIRVLIIPGLGPTTRKLKSLPNEKLRAFLSNPLLINMDGEVVYGDPVSPKVFHYTQSCVMTVEGPCPIEHNMTFLVFDDFTNPEIPYQARYNRLVERVQRLPEEIRNHVKLVPHRSVNTFDEVLSVEALAVERGYEGIMLRSKTGRYKFGRSSPKEQILFKLKRFTDTEGTVIGFEELMHNENIQERDELGNAKRSSSKENLVPANTLGALIVKHDEFEEVFKIGTGFSQAQRDEIWSARDKHLGALVSFKYQPSGTKDLPRFPSFKGFRWD